jgi:uncharacterized protein YbjT (DUF2867 family)
MFSYITAVILLLVAPSLSFQRQSLINSRHQVARLWQLQSANGNDNSGLTPKDMTKTFKSPFSRVAFGLSSGVILSTLIGKRVNAAPSGPVVVLGAGGKTGALIVSALAKRGVPLRPTSRSGGDVKGVSTVAADVTRIDTLEAALNGASAVIFAASASSKGGNAEKVDYLGVQNVAKECVRLKVPKLVVISSGAITRPNSLGFKLTNLFGNIMEYKLKGEDALKAAYAAGGGDASYVIIRPGGLIDGQAKGPSGVILNQGDAISGEIARADVAECAVAAALSNKIPRDVTFELYNGDGGAGPLEGSLPAVTGFERRGADYDSIFEGLKSGEISVPYKRN